MPLVLSLKCNEDFYVGDERFVVSRVLGAAHFWIKHMLTVKTGRITRVTPVVHEITDKMATEVLTDVYVSAGASAHSSVRVNIEAPQEILVLRGEKYRNPPAHLVKHDTGAEQAV